MQPAGSHSDFDSGHISSRTLFKSVLQRVNSKHVLDEWKPASLKTARRHLEETHPRKIGQDGKKRKFK